MVKITVLGDIHGNPIWQDIVNKEHDSNLFVFLGDYLDSYGHSVAEQIFNFKNILKFKEEKKENVVLLLGNHDYHNMNGIYAEYSGFNPVTKLLTKDLFEELIKGQLIQVCYLIEGICDYNLLFVHAGITNTWCVNNGMNPEDWGLDYAINELFYADRNCLKFSPGRNFSNTGDDITQSPIWVRPQSLEKDRIPGKIQIIGHTMVRGLVIGDYIIQCDTLNTSGEYLVIENNDFKVKKINL